MNITNLPSSEGPLDIILKYSNNYSACFRTCRFLRGVVDRIFRVILKKDFEIECANPFLTYQRKKFALYSKIPEHGLNILEGPLLFISFSTKYYAYSAHQTVVRDRATNAVIARPFATPMNQFGFMTPILLKIDQYICAIEGDAKDNLNAVARSTTEEDIKEKIQPFIPYSLKNIQIKVGRNIVAINKQGYLDIFLSNEQKFVQTSTFFPEKIYYIKGRLFLYSHEQLIDYDFINDKKRNFIFIPELFKNVMDIDNDYVLVDLFQHGPSILHFPTQKILQSFQESKWTISSFDCMIYKDDKDPNTQRRYYLKKTTNELSHFSA